MSTQKLLNSEIQNWGQILCACLLLSFLHFVVQRTEKSRKSRLAEVSMKDRLEDAHDTISSEKTSKKEISTGE